jgi:hypothetical protein
MYDVKDRTYLEKATAGAARAAGVVGVVGVVVESGVTSRLGAVFKWTR